MMFQVVGLRDLFKMDSSVGLTSQQYIKEGFCEGTFSKADIVWEFRKICENFLRNQFGRKCTLSEYHNYVTSEQQHRDLHYELTQIIQESQLHKQLTLQNLNHFQLDVQSEIGLHI